MTTYGYVRVSTSEQNIERQIVKMRELGILDKHIYIDHASGKNLERPEWQRLMNTVQLGDTLVIDSLDRLGRRYDDVISEWKRLTREVGCDIKALDLEFFDSANFRSMGDIGKVVEDMLLSLLAYVAETERKKMLQRQSEGIAVAKAAGKYKGRVRKNFEDGVLENAISALANGAGKSEIARMLGVTRTTVNNMVKDGRLTA